MTQQRARTLLLVTTILAGAAGLVGIAAALMSFMMFDAPGSEKNPATIVLFLSVLTFPIVCAVSAVLAWVFYAFKKFSLACATSFLPAINLLTGAAALAWLEIFNHGNFA